MFGSALRRAIALVFLGVAMLGCESGATGDRTAPVSGAPTAEADGQSGAANPSQIGDPNTPSGHGSGSGGASGGAAVPASTAGSGAGSSAAGATAPDAAPPAVEPDSGAPAQDSGGTSAPTLPPVTSVDADGPFDTASDLSTGPGGDSGLFYPTELGKDGVKHPIFVWGCGGGSNPMAYADHMNRIASHGFVAIASIANIGDGADVLRANLDWLLAENERQGSMLYGKLDPSKVAAGGHSIGSVNTFPFAADPRVLTSLYVAGGSLDNVNDPSAPTTGMGGKSLTRPAAFISAETDIFGNDQKLQADYDAATAPVFMTTITGADHVSAARDGLPVMVGWLRWQLAGESDRRSMFLDPSGEFRTGRYVSQSKNW